MGGAFAVFPERLRFPPACSGRPLPRLRAVVGNPGMNDTELCFRALYAAMLYRIKGEGDKQAVTDTLEYISPVIAELADMYGKVERGEIDLFKTDTAK